MPIFYALNECMSILFLRCGCDDCVISRTKDTVHHSRSRMNAFRALASPSLICLTTKDPIYSAFQLSWELRRLGDLEHEFRSEYKVSYEY